MKTTATPPPATPPGPLAALFERLPWEKVLLWTICLAAMYMLRHFVFIVLLTFLVSYVMRALISRILAVVSPTRERPWLERGLAVAGYVLLLGGLYGVGTYVGPRLFQQGNELVGRLSKLDPELEFQSVLGQTFGTYLFRLEYGRPGTPEYDAALRDFEKRGLYSEDNYQRFARLRASLRGGFESTSDAAAEQRKRAELASRPPPDAQFDAWFMEREKATRTEKAKVESTGVPPLGEEELDAIARRELADVKGDPLLLATMKREWRTFLVDKELESLRKSPRYEEEFKQYYEDNRADNPEGIPYDFATYIKLERAFDKGEAAFAAALDEHLSTDAEDRQRHVQDAFETYTKNRLATSWWSGSAAALALREHATTGLSGLSGSLAGFVRNAVAFAVNVPIQVLMSLLLSFFITFDFPSLREGVKSLRNSRLQPFYEEIAPEVVSFGRLIGLAFYAQSIVALFNSVLTWIAMVFLGIDHPLVLTAIVFFCSFIPVFGVILSGIPIVVVAIVQPGGSIILALEVVAVILAIHFLESSVFNPRILGTVLHLHPVLVFGILLVGEHFFGVWGLLLGVPVAKFIIAHVILGQSIPGIDTPRLAKAA